MELYPFRYRDPLTAKWVKARYLAERHEIAARYAEWELTGPPETREPSGGVYFRPFPAAVSTHVSNVQEVFHLTGDERYLVLLFLRRYVRSCARRRLYARMEGAAQLFRRVVAGVLKGPEAATWRG